MLLRDVFLLERLQVMNESASGKKKIRGVFQRADEANNNKRVYPKKVLESAIKSLTESVQNRRLVGELDHPDYDVVKLGSASHLITNVYMEGNEVIGEAEILSTPAGKIVESLINDGVQIGISSRGLGTLSEGDDGNKTVNEDFKLLTFDVVADPSTRGAYPGLTESTEHSQKVNDTIKKVVGKEVFMQMLREEIDENLKAIKEGTFAPKRHWKDYSFSDEVGRIRRSYQDPGMRAEEEALRRERQKKKSRQKPVKKPVQKELPFKEQFIKAFRESGKGKVLRRKFMRDPEKYYGSKSTYDPNQKPEMREKGKKVNLEKPKPKQEEGSLGFKRTNRRLKAMEKTGKPTENLRRKVVDRDARRHADAQGHAVDQAYEKYREGSMGMKRLTRKRVGVAKAEDRGEKPDTSFRTVLRKTLRKGDMQRARSDKQEEQKNELPKSKSGPPKGDYSNTGIPTEKGPNLNDPEGRKKHDLLRYKDYILKNKFKFSSVHKSKKG